MPKSIQSLASRAALLGVALLLVCFAFGSIPAEAAVSGCKYSQGITTYYSDSTYSTPVSFYTSGCNGGCNGSGPITKWWRFDHVYCTD